MSDKSETVEQLARVSELIENERFDEALKIIQDLKKAYGEFAELLSLTGIVKAKKGMHSEAESDFRRAIEMNPDCFSAWKGLSNLYSEQQNNDKARETFREILRIDPDDYESLIGIAAILFGQKEYEEATEKAQRATMVNPTSGHGFVIIGLVELMKTEFDTSEMYFRKAIDLSPEQPMPRMCLATVLRLQGKHEEAQEVQSTLDQM